jgi:hypothetical protein
MPDEEPVPLGLYLQVAPPREVIARMLRNLKAIHRSACDWQRLAAVQQRLVILLPEAWEERRDRALVLAELGCHGWRPSDWRSTCTSGRCRRRPALAPAPGGLARPALMKQIPLAIGPQPLATFESFLPGPNARRWST